MELVQFLTLAGLVVGIAAGIVQIVDYLRRRSARDSKGQVQASSSIWRRVFLRSDRRSEAVVPASAPSSTPSWLLDQQQMAPELDMADIEQLSRSARIQQVLREPAGGELSAWERHLRRHLIFPYQARVLGKIHIGDGSGDLVLVRRIVGITDGQIIVDVLAGNQSKLMPIQLLHSTDFNTSNGDVINDFLSWLNGR